MLKGNKGEWSELYVFAKLLSEGKLYQSDIDLNTTSDNFYEIIKVYRTDSKSRIEYQRDEFVSIYKVVNNSRELLREVDIKDFESFSKILYKAIRTAKGKSFAIENIDNFIELSQIQKLTALVSGKTDITLRIYDHRLAKEADLGFSIKSLLGGDSTLLNTGPGNNFIYEAVKPDYFDVVKFNSETYKPLGRISKLTERLQKLTELGINLEFKEIQSKQLWRNLMMVDGDLPKILAYALLYRWIDRDNSIINIAKKLEERDPLNFYNNEVVDQKLYEYKLQKLLVESAMGMTSEKPWHGVYDATGGIIIAKTDGDIVCFHIYDFNLFRQYLLNNTVFEQASTGENEEYPGTERTSNGTKKYYYGWIYEELLKNDSNLSQEQINQLIKEENFKLKFKINLQIRFR